MYFIYIYIPLKILNYSNSCNTTKISDKPCNLKENDLQRNKYKKFKAIFHQKCIFFSKLNKHLPVNETIENITKKDKFQSIVISK